MNSWLDDLNEFGNAILHKRKMACASSDCAGAAPGIYRNTVYGNLQSALGLAYPVIRHLVGDAFFAVASIRYIESHPSTSGNLHDYGAHFGAFLDSFPPAQALPYLPDVANLEWACHLAYFAADAGPLDVASLARTDPGHRENLRFLVNPACHIVRSSFPVVEIWQAHQPGMPEDFSIDARENPQIALVSRKNDLVRVEALKAAEAQWLEDIRSGIPLGQATEAASGCHADFELRLARWVDGEIFRGFETRID